MEKEKDLNELDEKDKSSAEEEQDKQNTVEEEFEALQKRVQELEKSLEDKTEQFDRYFDMLQRTAAEFENYKKRTAREKASICGDTTCDVVLKFLPVLDNIERALNVADKEHDSSLKEGIMMVYKQIKDVLESLGVEAIAAVGEEFDPELHEAISHINDEDYGENEVIEELQKGYRFGDKVIRHSVVRVAN